MLRGPVRVALHPGATADARPMGGGRPGEADGMSDSGRGDAQGGGFEAQRGPVLGRPGQSCKAHPGRKCPMREFGGCDAVL